MTFDDYKNAVKTDALQVIEWGEYDYCDDVDDVIDAMWTDDAVTGNGSGSYTFNTYKAQQNVSDLIWDEEFLGELAGMCIDLAQLLEDGPEAVDVTARCLALGFVYDDIRDAFEERREDTAA